MYDTIQNFDRQFAFQPKIENGEHFHPVSCTQYVVTAMGGSALAADFLKIFVPEVPVVNWRDYGLPPGREKENTLIIAHSYSGNTEETVSAFHEARKRGLPLAVIATGGELLSLAKRHAVPYVEFPDTGIQPRSATGYAFRALLKLMGEEKLLEASGALARTLDPKKYEYEGKQLAARIKNYVPVVCASLRNAPLAYIWKIKFNETGKIPAFSSMFPELNHNEMTGFELSASSRALTQPFHFIFIRDPKDHPRVQKRMELTREMYKKMKLPVAEVEVRGDDELHAVFSNIVLGDWAAYYTAQVYGHDPENIPLVEELKRLMR